MYWKETTIENLKNALQQLAFQLQFVLESATICRKLNMEYKFCCFLSISKNDQYMPGWTRKYRKEAMHNAYKKIFQFITIMFPRNVIKKLQYTKNYIQT